MRKAQPNTIPLPLSPLVDCNAAVMRLTVDQYQRMMETGIAQYVIINLPDRLIEIYTEPQVLNGRYCRTQSFRTADKIRFSVSGNRTIEMTAKSLLP